MESYEPQRKALKKLHTEFIDNLRILSTRGMSEETKNGAEETLKKFYSFPEDRKFLDSIGTKTYGFSESERSYLIAIFGEEKTKEICGDNLNKPSFDD